MQKQPEEAAVAADKEEAKPAEQAAAGEAATAEAATTEAAAEPAAAAAEATTPTEAGTPATPNAATSPDTKEAKKKEKVRCYLSLSLPASPSARVPRVGVRRRGRSIAPAGRCAAWLYCLRPSRWTFSRDSQSSDISVLLNID